MNDVFQGVGIKIRLATADDFLKVKETLTRLGIASERTKTLYQSCHILHKRGEYAIVHFKELFALDGKPATIDTEDIQRRNTIALLLQDWGLLSLVDNSAIPDDGGTLPMRLLKVIPFKEKAEWNLVSKYKIGQKRTH